MWGWDLFWLRVRSPLAPSAARCQGERRRPVLGVCAEDVRATARSQKRSQPRTGADAGLTGPKNHSTFDASSARGDRSPFVSVTCPAMAWPLNFWTIVVKPLDVAST